MDIDAVYFEMQRFKNERAWYNLNLPRESIQRLLGRSDWYTLFIPAADMEFTRFDQVRHWEEIAVALLKKYCDRFYKHHKQEWEADYLEYHELREDDPNFVHEYRLLIEQSQDVIAQNLQKLKDMIVAGTFTKDWSFGNLQALWFGQHLYQPLLHFKSDLVEVSPVSLNDGERDFVVDLRTFYEGNKAFFEGKDLYLLRNRSRKGIGFFEAGNFYPDFIVWMLVGDQQYVTFVDPKGLRNLEGPDDPKVRFYKTIKEIQLRLNDPSVILNSFIISNTPAVIVGWWDGGMDKPQLEACHVLFQREDKETYVKKLLTGVVGR